MLTVPQGFSWICVWVLCLPQDLVVVFCPCLCLRPRRTPELLRGWGNMRLFLSSCFPVSEVSVWLPCFFCQAVPWHTCHHVHHVEYYRQGLGPFLVIINLLPQNLPVDSKMCESVVSSFDFILRVWILLIPKIIEEKQSIIKFLLAESLGVCELISLAFPHSISHTQLAQCVQERL